MITAGRAYSSRTAHLSSSFVADFRHQNTNDWRAITRPRCGVRVTRWPAGVFAVPAIDITLAEPDHGPRGRVFLAFASLASGPLRGRNLVSNGPI
jgi:hypothetical protein